MNTLLDWFAVCFVATLAGLLCMATDIPESMKAFIVTNATCLAVVARP